MYEKQMELFEDGGLRDEGGMVDEESGNEVPVGSTRKEVRDDIPAMLSEGEFVFPADVVRYIGLENLMRMRQDAKQGLKRMDAMGQMGNGDEATMPDDLPFGMMDLIILEGEEEPEVEKKAQGGVVHMNEGGFTTNSFRVPKFDPRNQDVRQFENSEGKKLNIPFLDGKPVYPIPEGYFPVGTVEEEKDETKEAIPTDDDDDGGTPPPQSEFQKAGGWDMDFGDPPDSKKVDLWINEAKKTTGNTPAVMTGIAALFGGLPAAAVSMANKFNASQRDANMARVLEAAKKTPKAGQVAALNEIVKEAEEGANTSLLGNLGGVVKEIFGLSDEDSSKIEKVSVNSGIGLSKQSRDSSPKPKLRPTNEDLENEAEELGITGVLPKLEDQEPLSDKTPPSPTELEAAPAEQLEVGPAIPTSSYDEVPTRTDIENALAQKSTAPQAPQIATPAELRSPMLGEGDLEQAGIDVMPEAFSSVGRQAMKQPKFESPIPPEYQELRTVLDDLRSSMDRRGPVSGMTMPEKLEDPLGPFIGAGKFEDFTNKVAEAVKPYATDRKPKPPAIPTEPPKRSSRDDDGPSLAEKMQKQMQEQAKEASKTADYKIKEVQAKAQDRGATQAEQDKIVSEGEKVKEKLKQQSKGIKTGFKKGGLASRKK
jgi:hypothetical protein